MAKIRHIAIATPTPLKDARFYAESFGFEQLTEETEHPLGKYVIITDGTLNVAFVDFTIDQISKGLNYSGLHHIGVLVEDAEQADKTVLAHGANKLDLEGGDDGGFEVKYTDPSGLVFDIAQHPWLGTSL